jgi:hypothetical protein
MFFRLYSPGFALIAIGLAALGVAALRPPALQPVATARADLPHLSYDRAQAQRQAEAFLRTPPARRGSQGWRPAFSYSQTLPTRPAATRPVPPRQVVVPPAGHRGSSPVAPSGFSTTARDFAKRLRAARGR